MDDLIEAAAVEPARRPGAGGCRGRQRAGSGRPDHHALAKRRRDHRAYVERFRGQAEILPSDGARQLHREPAALPAARRRTGCSICARNGLGGFLADDMGLGKTAQTIAHIVIEQAEGRLDRPALIVVPTSLVPNWTAELDVRAASARRGAARAGPPRDAAPTSPASMS